MKEREARRLDAKREAELRRYLAGLQRERKQERVWTKDELRRWCERLAEELDRPVPCEFMVSCAADEAAVERLIEQSKTWRPSK